MFSSAREGHVHPLFSGRVALVSATIKGARKQEEPIVGAQEVDLLNPRQLREEGGGIDERYRFP
jgi:hypothetical protein